MNSSRTWKSGEMCRVTGLYRCRTCKLGGAETVAEFRAGTVLPMCDVCPDKDATYHFLKETTPATVNS